MAERERAGKEERARAQAQQDVRRWEQGKVDSIDNSRLAIRGYLELTLSNNNPLQKAEIEDITSTLEQL